MTTMTSHPVSLPGPHRAGRPSLSRLTGIELRKFIDTRAGRWLVVTIVAVAVAAVVVQLIVLDDSRQTYRAFFAMALLLVGILLPVLGILLVTSEWSQRTALTTFALVPLRQRIVVAKLAAGVITAVLSVAASLVVAALACLVSRALGGDGIWDLTAATVGNALLFQLINMIMGVAFGMLLLNSPLAIVLFFLVPTLWSVLVGLAAAIRSAARWLDIGLGMEPLLEPSALDAGQWARLGTAVLVWLVLPLILGVIRVLRTEVK